MPNRSEAGLLRARRDLAITSVDDGWVVKDPLSLEYFRLGDREHFLLSTLAEPCGVGELTLRYQERFPNERATRSQVLAFCAALRDCSLLIGGERKPTKTSRFAWLLSPLAIRLPGVDPTGLLDATAWLGRMLLSRGAAIVTALAAVVVVLGLVGEADALLADLSSLVDLGSPRYLAGAVLALMLTKSWHELGHAMACRRVGAECHEVGVLLLALAPCLYCDASDAWTLPRRRQRVLVAMAGVWFELMLAVVAAGAWLLLAPGPLRVLTVAVAAAASLSTLLVNLNPLLRFDGYYVLADAWGVPNLREQARDALWRGLRRWVRGDRAPAEPFAKSRLLLGGYGLASGAYSLVIVALLLWGAYHLLAAWGFRAAGDVIVALTAGGLLLAAGRGLVRLFPRGPGAPRMGATLRLGLLLGLALAVVFSVASIEIEQSLRSPCRLEPAVYADVVAPRDGLLRGRVAYGDRVEAGAVLGELSDLDMRLRLAELREREVALQANLDGLVTRSASDPSLLQEIARLKPTLAEVRRQRRNQQDLEKELQLRAPVAGIVQPVGWRPEESPLVDSAPEAVAGWAGQPLDAENTGCLLASGEALCRVSSDRLQAVILLGEDDSALVRVGDPIRLALDRSPGAPITGRIERIALAAAAGEVTEAEGALERSLRGALEEGVAYRVEASLTETTAACQPGAVGQARVVTGRETIGGWVLRWLSRLMRFG